MIRGGTWFVNADYCNTTRRALLYPQTRDNGDPRKNDYSFRVVTSEPF